MRAAWIVCAAAVLAACNISLPNETQIEDLRILEVRAEPPEMRFVEPGHSATTAADFLQILARYPNREEVRLSGIAAHPDLDATFKYEWSRCVPFQDLPCEDGGMMERFTETSSVISFSPIELLLADVADAPSPEQALLRITNDPRDLLNGVYAHMIFTAVVDQAKVPVDRLRVPGLKRFVIFDPLLIKVSILEARRLAASGQTVPTIEGVDLPTLCTNVDEAQIGRIFQYLDTRQPNRAPSYVSLEYAKRSFGVETPTVALGRDEIVALAPGEQLVMRGRALERDKEAYALIDDNCQLQELNETLAWSWFTNLGSLSAAITIEGSKESNRDGETVIYSAPLRPNLNADVTRARIWSVLRDGRGGSEAKIVNVEIRR